MTDNTEAPVVEPTADEPKSEEDLVVEEPLTEEEQDVLAQHEKLAADLAPGETLPWVAPPPSGVAEERAVEGTEADNPYPDAEEAEGTGSDVDSSRHETVENPPDTETESDTAPEGQYEAEKDDENLV